MEALEVAKKIAAEINEKGGTDAEKAKMVLDALADRCKFGKTSGSTPKEVLIEGKGQCEGYARAANMIFNELGIPCEFIIGTSHGNGHAWNRIRIDGEFYTCDPSLYDKSGKRIRMIKIEENDVAKDEYKYENDIDKNNIKLLEYTYKWEKEK